MREKIEAVEKKRGDCFAVSRTFTEHDTTTFAEITRDYNPVYFDRSFASLKTFNDRICHGLLGGSILTEIGGQIGWLASGMNFLFKKPVYTQVGRLIFLLEHFRFTGCDVFPDFSSLRI